MALSIAPSENWLGNDGNWSTFVVNIGSPPQQMQILPATSQPIIAVVLSDPQPGGCPPITNITNCAELRGYLFDSTTDDSSWSPQTAADGDPDFVLPFPAEEYLPNYAANASVGTDLVSLAWSGSHISKSEGPLQSQLVAGYVAPNPWLGMLGLSGRPVTLDNYTTFQPSVLQSLVAEKHVPGRSWGYTAGAQYAQPLTFGSLTFGGYDAARTNMDKALTVLMGTDSNRDLQLVITNITFSNSGSVSGLSLDTFIDSVVPDIWLPVAACKGFEKAFGLVWNDTYSMYLLNETQHNTLTQTNPSVTLYLAATASGSAISITLPYAAFDLRVQYPYAGISGGSSLHYFPLQQAANDSQYTLGRVFLQEAYVTADYDRGTFTVSQAIFPAEQALMDIKTVYPPGHHKLSGGDIAGIVVGAVATIALAAGFWFWRWNKLRKEVRRAKATVRTTSTSDMTDMTVFGETSFDGRRMDEYLKSQDPVDGYYGKPELDATSTPTGVTRQRTERHMSDHSELSATETATGFVGRHTGRHELESNRPPHQRWGSSQSGQSNSAISPLGEERVQSLTGAASPTTRASDVTTPPGSPPAAPRTNASPHQRQDSAGTLIELHELS